jgi:hypothetical protein
MAPGWQHIFKPLIFMFALAELHASPVRQVSVWSSQSNGCSVAFPNDGSWPGAPVEHIAAKQTYGNPPPFPSSAFSEYWEPPLPARSRRSKITPIFDAFGFLVL